MLIEIITTNADPERGGFGNRVHGLVSMFSQFADVRVVLTDWAGGARVPGVTYTSIPLKDTVRTKVHRLRAYYRADFPRRAPVDPPDFVVVESLDLLGLHQYGPGVPMILDEHNVYWNLLRYEIPNAPFFRGPIGRRAFVRRRLIPSLLARAKRFEVQAIRDSRRTFVTSDEDQREVLAEVPDAAPKLHVLPNCVDVQRIPALPDDPASRNVLFVGDFNYVPNREAAEFISRTLAPGLPEAQLLLVGADPPADAVGSNVAATGRVPDLLKILQGASVCIAPLTHGSGTRIKILTYLAAARPVVATAKACEGLPVRDGHHLLIRDDPREFRAAIQELLEDSEHRRRLGATGRQLVESKFDWRVHVPYLRDLVSQVAS